MDETFQLRIGCLSYLPYLVESQLAGEHDLSESAILQKAHFPRCAVVTLGAGMKGNGGKIHPQKTHVLHYQRIDTGMIKLPDKAFHGIELAVVDDGVDRDVDLDTIDMRELNRAADILYGVGGSFPCPVCRATHIHGVRPVENGFTGYVGIRSRSEQFKYPHFLNIRSMLRLSSRSLIDWRLSYCFLPRPIPMTSLA